MWTAVSTPLDSRLTAADQIRDTEGRLVPGYFLGGHLATVTQVVADELTTAGFGAYVT